MHHKYKNRTFYGVILLAAILSSFILLLITKYFQTDRILPPNRITERRNIVIRLHTALDLNDYKKAAFFNSILAQEALQRSYHTLKAWENQRDPETGLVPRDFLRNKYLWNSWDNAADLFPFLLIASRLLDEENEHLWLHTLAKEREICGAMPCTIIIQPTDVKTKILSEQIFGASEYAKDGLLAVSERFGKGPWFDRLEEIMQAIVHAAYIETKFGEISSKNSEVNGEILQVLSRLYWMTKNLAYLEMAENIADAYLFEILPNNHFLPPDDWNFIAQNPESSRVRFNDHGNEIIPGLVEIYFLEKMQGRHKATLYRPEIRKLLDHLLTTGRNQIGLWYSVVDNTTGQPLQTRISDTWGYILNAYKIFDIAEDTESYTEEITRTMRAAATLKSHPWEWQHHDGYADSIESMLYLLPWFDIPECHFWVDDEIEVMFAMQSPSGFIGETYLDGNFIRTALLYASYKTQGTMIVPWQNDVYLGAAYDKQKKELYVHLEAKSEWEGHLKFDAPRHRNIWGMPLNYPRLNSTPEWYIPEPDSHYEVINLTSGEKSVFDGKSLVKGIPMHLNRKNSPLLFKVSLMT